MSQRTGHEAIDKKNTMTTLADYRSIFDIYPNDETLIGLREANPALQQSVDTEPTSSGMEELQL